MERSSPDNGMLHFVIADFFRRRRRVRRADDDIPLAPLLRVLIFWVLFGIGALVGGVAIVAGIAGSLLGSVIGGAAAIACLAGAVNMWQKLNRLN